MAGKTWQSQPHWVESWLGGDLIGQNPGRATGTSDG